MEDAQAEALRCLADIAYETQPGNVFCSVAQTLCVVLGGDAVAFYAAQGGWRQVWPRAPIRQLPSRAALLMRTQGEVFFQQEGWNGLLALHGAQKAEGAVWVSGMEKCPCEANKALARVLCEGAAPKLTAVFRHAQSGAPLAAEQMAALCHEVRTPLAVALSAAELLSTKLRRQDEATFHTEYEPYFTYLEHNMHRTLRLAENMLDIVRFEAQAEDYPKTNADIRKALESIVCQVQLQAQPHGVSVELLPGEPVCGVYAPEPFERIMLNLFTNAVRHSPQGHGRVEVQLYTRRQDAQTECCVQVADNGPGIAPDMMAHLFEKYKAGLQGPHGAGLGLYLAMGLAGKMGGTLNAENRTGGGAVFRLSFPILSFEHTASLSSRAIEYNTNEMARRVEVEFSCLRPQDQGDI